MQHHPPDVEAGKTNSGDLQLALEQGCGALLAMEASRARITTHAELAGAQADMHSAIQSLRAAIAQLREGAAGTHGSALGGGFVLGNRPGD
jgi:hypothetical protein